MKTSPVLALAVAALIASPPAAAQHVHGKAAAPTAAPTAARGLAEGEVRRIDRAKGTITIKHGPLEALGMGPMTMPFVVTDPAMLANVKDGDRVRFAPGQTSDGKLTVSRIEVVR